MRLPFLLAATLAVLTFVPALQAQKVASGPDPDRKATNVVIVADDLTTLAAASISYSSPTWRDSHDEMLDVLRGSNYMRLGTHWWTTLDTIRAVEIGDTRIEAGSYYLGLAVDKDGAFSLLVFDSKQVMRAGLLPATTALYRGDAKAQVKAPLTFAKGSLKETVVKLEIAITADPKAPSTGTLSIRWGKHELSAPVQYLLPAAKAAAEPKK